MQQTHWREKLNYRITQRTGEQIRRKDKWIKSWIWIKTEIIVFLHGFTQRRWFEESQRQIWFYWFKIREINCWAQINAERN
jgi:hypothetical protein